jgi:hypothetical protein
LKREHNRDSLDGQEKCERERRYPNGGPPPRGIARAEQASQGTLRKKQHYRDPGHDEEWRECGTH